MHTEEPARRERRLAVPAVPGSMVPRQALPLQGQRAGIVTRLLADMVDGAVVLGGLVLAYLVVTAARFLWRSWAFTFPAPSLALVSALGAITALVYLTASWGTTGRSYGKHLLGLRVVGPSGRLRLGGALLRAALCVAFPIGVVWVVVSPENRSLQDVVLRTSVVYDWLGADEPRRATPTAAG